MHPQFLIWRRWGTKINVFGAKLSACRNGGKTAIAEKDVARADLEATMLRLLKNCELTAITLAGLINSGVDVAGPQQEIWHPVNNFQVKESVNPRRASLEPCVAFAAPRLTCFNTAPPARRREHCLNQPHHHSLQIHPYRTYQRSQALSGACAGRGSYAQEAYSHVLIRIAQ